MSDHGLEELCGSDLVSCFPVNAAMSTEGKAVAAAKKRCPKILSLDEEELMSLLHGSDPVKIELNRLENEVKGSAHFSQAFFFSKFIQSLK